MPELPEVETMCRGIAPIVGQTIVQINRPPCERKAISIKPSVKTIAKKAVGQKVQRIDRLGKRVLIVLENESAIVIEPRMTGLVLLADPPSTEHLRLQIILHGKPDHNVLFWDRRGLGTVQLLNPSELKRSVIDRLGPDALVATADQLKSILGTSRRAIKVALLDQSAIAGVGNLYASEALFVSGIDPRTRCDQLTKPQWQRLCSAIHSVLREAITHEGSTLSDGTYRNALNDAGSYQNYHRVYDRAVQTCKRCQTGSIRRIVQAQRSTFFCPDCQQRRGKHASVDAASPSVDQP
ncbi:Formamidopyrimidine-DNA glycosylase [Stieleria bergensis]|uniref:Formamidopyrimidine-DNA glycosylase n=1 Tax=Stieleria bergensis TaxID=2528025 RepID=A0A517SQB7_9BACT|nr:Formamidopyrimidine-DNA glycosylase [Planctomycetes bacterium SV_7m_r]